MAQPEPASAKAVPVKFKATCGGCGRTVTRRSRRALTWKCPNPDCGRVNPGPGLVAQMAQPPQPGTRRRVQRRAAAAEQAPASASETTSTKPAPAPVRRKPKAGAQATRPAATEPQVSSKGPARVPATPPPAPRRGGLLERVMYGGD